MASRDNTLLFITWILRNLVKVSSVIILVAFLLSLAVPILIFFWYCHACPSNIRRPLASRGILRSPN